MLTQGIYPNTIYSVNGVLCKTLHELKREFG